MRRLAQELGVVPMAMYKHVTDKGDLRAGMIDAVISEYPVPDHLLAWRESLRLRVRGAREALGRHPWMRHAIEQSTSHTTPVVLAHMNAVAGDLRRGDFTYDQIHYAMHALGHRIWGFSPEAFSAAPPPSAPPTADDLAQAAALFPHVVAIAHDAASRNPGGACEQDREFDFTLELLLDAFDRLRADGWESR